MIHARRLVLAVLALFLMVPMFAAAASADEPVVPLPVNGASTNVVAAPPGGEASLDQGPNVRRACANMVGKYGSYVDKCLEAARQTPVEVIKVCEAMSGVEADGCLNYVLTPYLDMTFDLDTCEITDREFIRGGKIPADYRAAWTVGCKNAKAGLAKKGLVRTAMGSQHGYSDWTQPAPPPTTPPTPPPTDAPTTPPATPNPNPTEGTGTPPGGTGTPPPAGNGTPTPPPSSKLCDEMVNKDDKETCASQDTGQVDISADGGMLGPFNHLDAYGRPLSIYGMSGDGGGMFDLEKKVTRWIMRLGFTLNRWVVGFGAWIIDWGLGFQLASILLTPLTGLLSRLNQQVIGPVQIRDLLLTLTALWAGYHILLKQRSRGFAEAGLSLVIAALAATVLAHPEQTLLGPNGVYGKSRDIAVAVATVAVDPQAGTNDRCRTDPNVKSRDIACPLSNALIDTFVVKPHQALNHGRTFSEATDGKPCVDAYNAYMGAVADDDGKAKDAAGDLMKKECHDDDIFKYGKKTTLDRMFGAWFVLAASLIAVALVTLIVCTLLAAQLWLAYECVRGLWALTVGVLPGGGRSAVWKWVSSVTQAVIQVVLSVIFLSIFLLFVQGLLVSFDRPVGKDAVPLVVRFIAVDVLVFASLAFRKKIAETSQSIGRNLNHRLQSARVGGTRGSIFRSPVLGGAPSLKRVWSDSRSERDRVLNPLRKAGRTAFIGPKHPPRPGALRQVARAWTAAGKDADKSAPAASGRRTAAGSAAARASAAAGSAAASTAAAAVGAAKGRAASAGGLAPPDPTAESRAEVVARTRHLPAAMRTAMLKEYDRLAKSSTAPGTSAPHDDEGAESGSRDDAAVAPAGVAPWDEAPGDGADAAQRSARRRAQGSAAAAELRRQLQRTRAGRGLLLTERAARGTVEAAPKVAEFTGEALVEGARVLGRGAATAGRVAWDVSPLGWAVSLPRAYDATRRGASATSAAARDRWTRAQEAGAQRMVSAGTALGQAGRAVSSAGAQRWQSLSAYGREYRHNTGVAARAVGRAAAAHGAAISGLPASSAGAPGSSPAPTSTTSTSTGAAPGTGEAP